MWKRPGLEGVFNGDDDVILDYHDGVIIMNQGDHLVAEGRSLQ